MNPTVAPVPIRVTLAQVGNPYPEPDYDTGQHDDNSGLNLFLGVLLAGFIAWLRKHNEENAPKYIGAGVFLLACVGAYNARPGQGVMLFVVAIIGGSFAAYFFWLLSGLFMGKDQ